MAFALRRILWIHEKRFLGSSQVEQFLRKKPRASQSANMTAPTALEATDWSGGSRNFQGGTREAFRVFSVDQIFIFDV